MKAKILHSNEEQNPLVGQECRYQIKDIDLNHQNYINPTFFLISNAAQKTSSPILKVRLKEPEFNLPIEPLLEEITKPTLINIVKPEFLF